MSLTIITGIGRSGTSAMMYRLITKSNNQVEDFGLISFIGKYSAGYENPIFGRLNEIIYKGQLTNLDVKLIKQLNIRVVKDPLFIRDLNIVRTWWEHRKDISIIYCKRDYNEIAKSQKKLPTMKAPVYRCFPEMMQKIEEEFLNEVEKLGIPIKVYNYKNGKLWRQ